MEVREAQGSQITQQIHENPHAALSRLFEQPLAATGAWRHPRQRQPRTGRCPRRC
jgi:hypothetical protein